jgi:quercetin dioxygenase-like cupin family protein
MGICGLHRSRRRNSGSPPWRSSPNNPPTTSSTTYSERKHTHVPKRHHSDRPAGGRTVSSGHGSSAELKLAGEQSDGDWAVVEWRVHAGDEPPIHTHTREDETLYVIEGAIAAFVGDQRIDVDAGSYAALPKDVPHGLRVRGDEARLLVTLEPAGAEYFLVPRDQNDGDPSRFGLVLHGPAPAA